jgi:glutaredoxin
MYTIIGREGCTHCQIIKELMKENGIEFQYKMMDEIPKTERFEYIKVAKQNGQVSLPIILKDGVFIKTTEVENMLND